LILLGLFYKEKPALLEILRKRLQGTLLEN